MRAPQEILMKSRRLFPILAVLLLFAVSANPAGIREKSFELGLYGGIEDGDNDANVGSSNAWGGKVAYAFSRRLMLELNIDHFDSTRELVGRAGPNDQPANQIPYSITPDTEFMIYTVGLNANFFTDRDVRTKPFLGVGLGAATEDLQGGTTCIDLNKFDGIQCSDFKPNGFPKDPNQPPASPSDIDIVNKLPRKATGTALTMSAGARTFLADWFGIRYEVRYFHHDTFNVNQDHFEASVGATFVVGGKK
jgi:hypothetical protein